MQLVLHSQNKHAEYRYSSIHELVCLPHESLTVLFTSLLIRVVKAQNLLTHLLNDGMRACVHASGAYHSASQQVHLRDQVILGATGADGRHFTTHLTQLLL